MTIEAEVNVKKMFQVWALLVTLIVLALVTFLTVGGAVSAQVALTLTVVEWVIVGGWFMHLNAEPKWVVLLLGLAVLCLVFLFAFSYFDVLNDTGVNWIRFNP
ncbi:MAG: hypothetical protein OEW12_06170 [Deltaproteobacteria bacterium]|nr:hypothetical protein [Deltaproteobacteria bacterium]